MNIKKLKKSISKAVKRIGKPALAVFLMFGALIATVTEPVSAENISGFEREFGEDVFGAAMEEAMAGAAVEVVETRSIWGNFIGIGFSLMIMAWAFSQTS